MSATEQGAQQNFEEVSAPISDTEAEDIFLKRFMPSDAEHKEQPSGEEEQTTQEQTAPEDANFKDEGDADASAEKPEDDEKPDDEEKDDKRKFTDADETYVKVKVGDEEHEVPVKELTRLYGQEASLTKKSMAVAEKQKAVDEEMTKAAAASAALLDRAKARFEPYSKIDFFLASKELSAEEYTALRTEAQAAFEDIQFLEKQVNDVVTGIHQKQENDLRETARNAIKELAGPADKGGIEGWNEKLYDDIRAHAVAEGAPSELVNKLVDPWAIRLIHQAMLYKRGAAKGVVVTKKVNKTPKKVIKTTITSQAAAGGQSAADKGADAMKRLRVSGKTEDAADVFLARWAKDSD